MYTKHCAPDMAPEAAIDLPKKKLEESADRLVQRIEMTTSVAVKVGLPTVAHSEI